MDNQHQKIKGYRDLSQADIDLVNEIKSQGEALQALVAKVESHTRRQLDSLGAAGDGEGSLRWSAAQPARWIAIARTDLQTGLMALTRAVAQPTNF